MTVQQIAAMIPAEYRKEILLTNMIGRAVPVYADSSMFYLGTIWKNFVAPEESLECGLCLERILNNYRQLEPLLIELEKQNSLLHSL